MKKNQDQVGDVSAPMPLIKRKELDHSSPSLRATEIRSEAQTSAVQRLTAIRQERRSSVQTQRRLCVTAS